MRSPLAIGLVFSFAAGACGETLPKGELADLKKRLEEAQRQSATAEKKIQDLEDRVFLLTDQIESQKVASTRREARLPVVTLRPTEPAAAPEETGDEISYEGAARTPTPDRVRPILRMSGHPSAGESRAARTSPSAPVDVGATHGENLGVAPAPTVPNALKDHASERPPLDADPLRLYRAAYDDLHAGRHDQAVRGFREFLRKYPRHDYADNAQYWLGECFYSRKQYLEAAGEFREVVTRYPNGNKAPDALLKLGFSLLSIGETKAGRDLLSQVPQVYPKTEAARLASERLAELRPKEDSK